MTQAARKRAWLDGLTAVSGPGAAEHGTERRRKLLKRPVSGAGAGAFCEPATPAAGAGGAATEAAEALASS